MIIVLLGPPGSGKGSQAERISERFNFITISIGSMFRNAISRGNNIGEKVKSYLARGKLVPDRIVFKVIKREFSKLSGEKGMVFDGFPRNKKQAESLDSFLDSKNLSIDVVLYFDVPFSVVSDRLVNRKICPSCGAVYNVKTSPPEIPNICDKCGYPLKKRKDDKKEIVEGRFKVYEKETLPIKEIYEKKGILVNIENDRSEHEIWEEVERTIEEKILQRNAGVKGGR
jgi:adenylate kinase